MSEIKPCPWCQREPHVSDCGMPENKDGLYAWCLTDGCANQQKVYKLTAWNSRAVPAPDQSDRERARLYLSGFHVELYDGINRADIEPQKVIDSLAAEFARVRAEERVSSDSKEIARLRKLLDKHGIKWDTETA